MYCGSRNTTSVYLKALPQPNISIDGEYGYAYVHISGGIIYPSYAFHAAVTASEKHKYFCSDGYPFDGHSRCSSSNGNEKSWLEARDECLHVHNQILAPYHLSYNSSLCFPQAQNGDYWIGMIWSRPKYTTTISTTSMRSTMSITTRTATTITTSMTPFIATNLKNTTMIASIAPPLLSATSHTTATTAAVAVIISVVLIAIVVSVVICYKKEKMCFKHRRNSVGVDDFTKITIPSTAVPSIPPGSTLAPSTIHH